MIISDEHRFAFIHIPKCAGSTVRRQLSGIDSYNGKFGRATEHPVAGRLDYPHLPLRVLAELFPDEFAKIRQYDSVALMRDPFERFLSSLLQRMRSWRRVAPSEFTREMLRQEAVSVIANLEPNPDRVRLEYSHFTRQCDYLDLNGEPIVHHVYSVDQLPAFSAFLEQRVGFGLDLQIRDNASVIPRFAWMRASMNVLRPAYTAILPAQIKHRLRSMMLRQHLYRDARDTFLTDLMDEPLISGFVEDFYRQDILRYRALTGDLAR